jgi:hypothetical protein
VPMRAALTLESGEEISHIQFVSSAGCHTLPDVVGGAVVAVVVVVVGGLWPLWWLLVVDAKADAPVVIAIIAPTAVVAIRMVFTERRVEFTFRTWMRPLRLLPTVSHHPELIRCL